MASIALLGVSSQASAAIVNIDAGVNHVSQLLLGPGSYTAEVIGVAQGGAYNAWSPFSQDACNDLGCSQGWINTWGASAVPGQFSFFILPGLNQHPYATPLAALAAWQGSPNLVEITENGPPYDLIPNPIAFSLNAPTLINFFINDSQNGVYTDNRGGVSIRISAVPEPSTWAMMISGFGLAGVALRRRRAAVAA